MPIRFVLDFDSAVMNQKRFNEHQCAFLTLLFEPSHQLLLFEKNKFS